MSRHRIARLTVEECLTFDVGSLKQALKCVDFPANSGEICWSGTMTWAGQYGQLEAGLFYLVGRTEIEGLAVLVDAEHTTAFPASVRLPGDYVIRITTTRPRIGGVRYWFRRPVEHDGKPCGRRVKKLYLPPDKEIFGCRYCHDLTYRSCQTHDNRKAALAREPDALETALRSKDPRRAVLGIGALALSVRRMRRQQAVGNAQQPHQTDLR
jgi:hypothetical protein